MAPRAMNYYKVSRSSAKAPQPSWQAPSHIGIAGVSRERHTIKVYQQGWKGHLCGGLESSPTRLVLGNEQLGSDPSQSFGQPIGWRAMSSSSGSCQRTTRSDYWLREAIMCQLCSFFKHCLNGLWPPPSSFWSTASSTTICLLTWYLIHQSTIW